MEEFVEQTSDARRTPDPQVVLAEYKSRVTVIKNRLDDFEKRCKFTHPFINDFIQQLIDIQQGINQFKQTLYNSDKQQFNHLLNGIRYALPLLDNAKEERANNDKMTTKCHNFIIGALRKLENALERYNIN